MIWFILGVFGILIAFVGFVSLVTALVLMIQYTVQNGFSNTCRDYADSIRSQAKEITAKVKKLCDSAAQAWKRRQKKKYKKTLKYKVDRLSHYFFRSQSEIQFLKARVNELEKTQYLTYCCNGDNTVQIYANGAWRDFGDRDGA